MHRIIKDHVKYMYIDIDKVPFDRPFQIFQRVWVGQIKLNKNKGKYLEKNHGISYVYVNT